MIKKCFLSFALLFTIYTASAQKLKEYKLAPVWSTQKANEWYAAQQWLVGANYIPANAINQLEMWQADTFSPEIIDKELQLAQSIGFNTLRVYLHSLAWKQDPSGFKKRIHQFLSICEKRGIKPMFVFFDDCWNAKSTIGLQPAPKVGVHNSGWLQDPGDPASKDSLNFPALEIYVKGILTEFKNDKRILMWDLYNEPGNSGKNDTSIPLLIKVIKWARAVNPDQPITIGLWKWNAEEMNAIQFNNSDVITYHDYADPEFHKRTIDMLQVSGRPLICTEYMARTKNSLFSNIMPLLKKENVGAINWGFVAGKTNTIYAWDAPMPDGKEPANWFHDIFRPDGTPYRQEEIDIIKKITKKLP